MKKKGIILFVDDEFYLLTTLRAIVKTQFREYNILFAESADEALELLDSHDEIGQLVVFSDWHMPGMKGDDLLVEIHQKYPQSVNYLLSGMISKEPERDVFEKGGIRKVLLKPWNNTELIDTLKGSLNEEFLK